MITQSVGLDLLFPLMEALGLHCAWARRFDMREYAEKAFRYSDDAVKFFVRGEGWVREGNGLQMPWAAPCLFLTRKSRCYDWQARGAITAYVMHFECVVSRSPERSLLDTLDLPMRWDEALAADLGSLIKEAAREYESPRLGTRLVLDGYLRLVLVRLLRSWGEAGEKAGSARGLLRLAPALNLVAQRMESIPSVSEMAAAANVSEGHFSQQFKAVLHVSPRQYVNRLRVDRARQLLMNTDMTIDQIARSLGFTYTHYFDRLFKCHMLQTPGEYRRKNQW